MLLYFRFIFSSLFGLTAGLLILELLLILSGHGFKHSLIEHWTQQEFIYQGYVILAGFGILGFMAGLWLNTQERIAHLSQEADDLMLAGFAKADLVSFAAHEIRSPLTGLNDSIYMLMKGEFGNINEKQQAILAHSYQAARDINSLVTEFLDASKIDSDKFKLILQQTSLEEVLRRIKSVIDEFIPAMEQKHINFNYQPVSKPQTKYVTLDQNRINEVIRNLMQNAINYSPAEGHIEASVKIENDFFIVSIADTGIGIPKGEQRKIFTKYYRAINAMKAVSGGSGLGLFLCKQIIEGHQGRIWFRSEQGKGTTFTFLIPLTTPVKVEDLFKKI